jgi:transcriptional regulator
VYIPRHFNQDIDQSVYDFIEQHGFAQLISSVNDIPSVSFLPFLLSEDKSTLLCHVAKQNNHAKLVNGQTVVVSFSGPHGYISPSWYASGGVPTWNYQAVNVYGTVTINTDLNRIKELVNRLTDKYERSLEEPWQPEYPDKMLQAISVVEITITDIQAKNKLSQNKSLEDQNSVIEALERQGNNELVQVMKQQQKPTE